MGSHRTLYLDRIVTKEHSYFAHSFFKLRGNAKAAFGRIGLDEV